MRSVNKIILIGNLAGDPKSTQTGNGQQITTFVLVTNREWTTQDGQKKTAKEFHQCVAWSKLAEICQTYMKKGQLVYIEGYLKTRSWDSEDGTRRFKTEIVVRDMIRLGKNNRQAAPEITSGEFEERNQDQTKEEVTITENSELEETKTDQESVIEPETPAENNETEDNPIDRDLGL